MAKSSLVKRAVRKGVAVFQEWLKEEPTENLDPAHYPNDGFAYRWINAATSRLLFETRNRIRAGHAWGILNAAYLAKALGIRRISLLEFGVAGGNGLVSMELAAERIEKILGVGIDIYGFDTGSGLPKPQDYRDLPNLWTEHAFAMDVPKLKARLKRSQLVLGLVQDTVPQFAASKPAPIGYVAFDLDYYSSTVEALKILELDHQFLLPRILCHFDDILGFTYSDFTGELLAMHEFNNRHQMRKISPIHGLRHFVPAEQALNTWVDNVYMTHLFDHPLYCRHDNLVKHSNSGETDLR
jgi:hypothetical protein